MSASHTLALLNLVAANSDASFLLRQGLTFSQIATLISNAMKQGLLVAEGNKLLVSDIVRTFIAKYRANLKLGIAQTWIAPDESFRTWVVHEHAVYLPKIKESYKLGGG